MNITYITRLAACRRRHCNWYCYQAVVRYRQCLKCVSQRWGG